MPAGRFSLGLGSGEPFWPSTRVRKDPGSADPGSHDWQHLAALGAPIDRRRHNRHDPGEL